MILLAVTIFGTMLGFSINDPVIGFCVGLIFGAMLQGPWTIAKEEMSTKEGQNKVKRDIQCQDDYDNRWGIIDYDNK